eukprot:1684999-Pyramimonas_sp.AAC.1
MPQRRSWSPCQIRNTTFPKTERQLSRCPHFQRPSPDVDMLSVSAPPERIAVSPLLRSALSVPRNAGAAPADGQKTARGRAPGSIAG